MILGVKKFEESNLSNPELNHPIESPRFEIKGSKMIEIEDLS